MAAFDVNFATSFWLSISKFSRLELVLKNASSDIFITTGILGGLGKLPKILITKLSSNEEKKTY